MMKTSASATLSDHTIRRGVKKFEMLSQPGKLQVRRPD
jgi:hypothetical protein